MPHAYTEDQLVEQPAIGLFAELGWQTVSALEETFGATGTLLRETKGEVVLVSRLRAALERLNAGRMGHHALPPEAITAAIDELTRDRSAMSREAANREVYRLLKEGIPISVMDADSTPHPGPLPGRGGEGGGAATPPYQKGGQTTVRVQVIDWEQPANNDFLLVSQFSITGALYTCRPDLVGFINGLPLVVIELKKTGVPARTAFDENLTHYKTQIPQLFWFNALLIASNGTDSRVGSLTADWERFFEWKRIEREDEPRRVSLEVMLRGTCDRTRLLDLVENFTLFSEHKAGLVKIIGQNHQFLGVNNAIAASLKARQDKHGRGGVFWQTQGSGKSFAMVFYAQKILRKLPGNWTFVVVTDRVELDEQIAKTFKATGAVSDTEGDLCHASSGTHLRELLRGNHRYVFTLIHKFQTPELLCDRPAVIVLTDEAHRSQYDTLALNMRSALPNALFLAFTGTPLIAGEERTREVFGDYVSIYDFQQSVEDGATVPLFYENRTPELRLENPDLNDDIYELIEDADLNDEAEKKLQRELGRQYHLITRDDRLETIAKDIVQHFPGRGFLGKAMVVCIDKATALKMHDRVQRHWQAERTDVETRILKIEKKRTRSDLELETLSELRVRLETITSTDMALIVSPEQNEIARMHDLGLDIEPHRRRMNTSQPPLDERFKDPDDPLRVVFVCAMWLTGFDAPNCSTVYLDKPMRNHTLMQTIARANRVFPGKHSGLIVDYANVFTSLEKALAIYGAGTGGRTPVREKKELIDDLRKALAEAVSYCNEHGVDVHGIEAIHAGSFDRVEKISDAVNSLISPDTVRKAFLAHERLVHSLYRAIKPDPVVAEFAGSCSCLATIADGIRIATGGGEPIDISPIMARVVKVLDESIATEGFRIVAEPGQGDDLTARAAILDLSKINFEALAKRYKESKTKNLEIEALKAAIHAQLERMVRINRTRVDYLEKFEQLITDYNAGSRNIDELFEELVRLSRNLTDEQQRHVRESLSEDELTVFDLLTKPDPVLTEQEKQEVKKVARQLLERLKEALVLDWRKRASSRARVHETIDRLLDESLPGTYTPEIFRRKCSVIFDHVYEAFPDRFDSTYNQTG